MRIAVCDDNKIFLGELEQMLACFPYVSKTECFSKIDSFFTCLQDGEPFDLVIMDLDWNAEENGMSYAQHLYTLAPHLPVLYATGFNDRFSQQVLLQKTNLVGYLTKPVDVGILEQYLQKTRSLLRQAEGLVFSYQDGLASLDTRQITYIESQNHVAVIHTQTASYQVREKLCELLLRLPDQFVQCHKSYAVNMHWIQCMMPGHLLLQDGNEIPISRSRAKQTREMIFKFMGLQI